jgi:tRNA (guanine-N7-)-methyltransferase
MARVRHRKSINPFNIRFDIERPDWASILASGKPIEVDLGFGRGEFIIEMARRRPDVEFIGLELRKYLIDKIEQILEREPLPNVRVFLANVKEHLSALFAPATLTRVYIHFPDPWTQRKKHHKRRMVDARLVATLHTLLIPGGEAHLMTDKQVVGQEMLHLFEAHGGFENACGAGQFCPASTTGLCTREERYYLDQGDTIHRLKFIRK